MIPKKTEMSQKDKIHECAIDMAMCLGKSIREAENALEVAIAGPPGYQKPIKCDCFCTVTKKRLNGMHGN